MKGSTFQWHNLLLRLVLFHIPVPVSFISSVCVSTTKRSHTHTGTHIHTNIKFMFLSVAERENIRKTLRQQVALKIIYFCKSVAVIGFIYFSSIFISLPSLPLSPPSLYLLNHVVHEFVSICTRGSRIYNVRRVYPPQRKHFLIFVSYLLLQHALVTPELFWKDDGKYWKKSK